MIKRLAYALIGLILLVPSAAGQYAPAAGEPGTTAIHRDSSAFVAWASECSVNRGYIKISDTTLLYEGTNLPTLGSDTSALGMADGGVVSLGDGGTAVLGFEYPIYNGNGPDFAVFENGFKASEDPFNYFLELAFVEVSSDSIRWVRFPAYSETLSNAQLATFDQLDPALIHNLAGKYQVFYGTPFDLEDLKDSVGIEPDSIVWIRIRDVVGCIHPSFGTKDAEGKIINDPWPTPFNSGGFDLDAVGVIHAMDPMLSLEKPAQQPSLRIYPNPLQAGSDIRLSLSSETETEDQAMIRIFNSSGVIVHSQISEYQYDMTISLPVSCKPGVYFLNLYTAGIGYSYKFIVIPE
ncbi:MAG: T9SS type A sorting domain-containing protein [Bacteroidales bacterium]|nr:T9SS type A sorting domain-containing protein [Bacteroidales bacterium]